jgi:hypothetical protein
MMKSGGVSPASCLCSAHKAGALCPVLRLEDFGFEVGMFSLDQVDVAAWRTRSRPPDLTELAGQAYRICGAGNLALLLDAHRGYALNVRRTVEELETAGIHAMSIEDTVLPRPYGHNGKSSLSSIEEGVGAMKAALSACQDKNPVIADAPACWRSPISTKPSNGLRRMRQLGSTRSSSPPELRSRQRTSGPGRPTDPSRVLGHGAGGLRHAEGAARGCAIARAQKNSPKVMRWVTHRTFSVVPERHAAGTRLRPSSSLLRAALRSSRTL